MQPPPERSPQRRTVRGQAGRRRKGGEGLPRCRGGAPLGRVAGGGGDPPTPPPISRVREKRGGLELAGSPSGVRGGDTRDGDRLPSGWGVGGVRWGAGAGVWCWEGAGVDPGSCFAAALPRTERRKLWSLGFFGSLSERVGGWPPGDPERVSTEEGGCGVCWATGAALAVL